jgi:hypothetical protein
MVVNLKCSPMYGMIGMREHDIVVREVVVRKGGCKSVQMPWHLTPNRITSPYGNLQVVLFVEVFLTYRTRVCMSMSEDSGCVTVFPTQLRYQRLPFPGFSLLTTTTSFFT